MSADQSSIFEKGTNPILLQTGKLDAELALPSEDWTLYALSGNGIRREKLACPRADGKLKITLNTNLLKNGPTPFFELVATP